MNVFHTHLRIVEDYATYIRSFLNIADPAIRAVVEWELEKGQLWPEPFVQFNPAFEMAGSVADLSRDASLHRAHERFSELMDRRHFQVVYPVLPMDLFGVYVLLPE